MAFRELMEGLQKTLPEGASDRYARLTALEKMLSGEVYEHLKFPFEKEKNGNGEYVAIRERRPSVDFNLAYEITQDTLAELFGDEQFPTVRVSLNGEQDEDGTKALATLIGPDGLNLAAVAAQAYEEGVVGAVAVILHRSDEGLPFYEILPAKYCEPIYASEHSSQLIGLVVTYPIDREQAEAKFPGITDEEGNRAAETFWYRFVVGPHETIDYRPLSDDRFAKLGEKDATGKVIEFQEHRHERHGFTGRAPVLYVKNPGGKQRELDGQALWWPIRNICIEIDYTLSQAGRGLRYGADPMLFVRQGDMFAPTNLLPAGMEKPAGGMATQTAGDGSMVRGATQVLEGHGQGADAKLLEISAAGITEEREFVRDLREYALEVIGGQKARAEHMKGAPSGTAIDKGLKPLRRLVRRLRIPYGLGLLLGMIDLTLYGFRQRVFDASLVEADVDAIPEDARMTLEWPSDETLKGAELLYHVQALEAAAGGSPTAPIQLVKPEAMGQKLVADLGLHEPYDTVKGDLMNDGERNPEPAPQIVKP